MFDSLFDSFHDTVAKAKGEREQLDRLLTISTPRERILVGAIAVVLAGLCVWLFLGSVPRTLALQGPCVYPTAGETTQDLSIEVDMRSAQRLTQGMLAQVALDLTGGSATRLSGHVNLIHEFRSTGAGMPTREYTKVHLDLGEDKKNVVTLNNYCQVFFDLGDTSPISLFMAE